MSDTKHDADAAIRKLNQMLDGGDIVIFTPDEARLLKEVAKAWQSAQGFLYIVGSLKRVMQWCVAFFVAWAVLKAGAIDWLKEVVSK